MKKKYEKIPEFDQSTQMVVQVAPIDVKGEKYYGVQIIELPIEKEVKDEFMGMTEVIAK